MLWLTHFAVFFLGIFIGILFAVRNKTLAAWISERYVRGKEKSLEYIRDKTGSIQVSPVSANVLIKYLLRFGVPLLGIIGLIALLKPEMVTVILYKCCLILVGFTLAESIWVVGYKYVFGRVEKEDKSEESRRSILIFRGMLYAAIILGLTLGL